MTAQARTTTRGENFLQGNEAIVDGAIAAGCRFFAGYPISPSSEILEKMAVKLPPIGGISIQMEDELSAIAAAIGASWTGQKAMTATSGPGLSLMQENIGYAIMTETPLVIVDVQRGGPSTGLPTLPSQGDVMQARWGTHGDHSIIALAPASVQECFDLTIEAFNLSEEFRTPVIMLSDAHLSHMRESLSYPVDPPVSNRRESREGPISKPFEAEPLTVPPFPTFGQGHRVHVTGLTHSDVGYPTIDPAVSESLTRRLVDKIEKNTSRIGRTESIRPGSEIMIVAYGSSARAAKEVVYASDHIGIFRPITLWPFPASDLAEALEGTQRVLVVEMNYGQLYGEIERHALKAGCKCVEFMPQLGGILPDPDKIQKRIAEMSSDHWNRRGHRDGAGHRIECQGSW